jgi:hypothetical protein
MTTKPTAHGSEEAAMPPSNQSASAGKAMLWTGRAMSALPALFLLFDAIMKFVKPQFVVDATVKLGFPESTILGLGIVLLVCTAIYLIPQTAVLGAILLTGYLGGAVATHVRHEDGLFEIIFPVIFGALLWGGLYLRDERLRSIIPWRR